METKNSSLQLHEISDESEGSETGSYWDDSEEDPDYEMLEETHSKFSNLSLKNKAKARVVKDKGLGGETDSEVVEVNAPVVDEDKVEKVQKIIEGGLIEKLKVDECKVYLRKNGLRLTGNKDTLIHRIKEHLEILNGGGEKKHPPSSFVLNCKGDACTGDVVLFEQNVYEMFNIASRSASGPPCGKRIVAGRIVKESYGAAKQQHTFTIEVLWSKGEKPLPPLYPLLIKGRNLYRLKTLRQKWEDEGQRQKILMEKHSRGSVARADREARIQEKEKRKKNMENRVSRKDSVSNQYQSHSGITISQHQPQPQETDVSMNPEKPEFPSQNSGLSANIRKETYATVNKPAAVTEQHDRSKTMVMGFDQWASSGRTSFTVHHVHNEQAWKHPADRGSTYEIDHRRTFNIDHRKTFDIDHRRTFDINHMRGTELDASYYYADLHSREQRMTSEKFHPFIAETAEFRGRTHHRMPLANANQFHSPNRESCKQKQLCRHYSRGRCYFGDNCKFIHDLRDRWNA